MTLFTVVTHLLEPRLRTYPANINLAVAITIAVVKASLLFSLSILPTSLFSPGIQLLAFLLSSLSFLSLFLPFPSAPFPLLSSQVQFSFILPLVLGFKYPNNFCDKYHIQRSHFWLNVIQGMMEVLFFFIITLSLVKLIT